MRFLLVTLLCVSAAFGQGGGGVQFRDLPPLASTGRPVMACKELRSLTELNLSVISATVIPASKEAPEHCRVNLMAPPEINIQVNLPTAWNGRLYMFGNGGWAGETFESAGRAANRARGLHAAFLTAATDTGHSAIEEPGASFALNRQKLLDFGFRSLHVTVETAKMLAKTYYASAPTKSYYEGCSQGGRQGLTLAQRFPNDFDGIIAGAPALFQTGTHSARAYWIQWLNQHPLPASKMGLLASRVYGYCDAKDGLQDGLIDDPRRCDFRPARDLPHCNAGTDQADCFTADQIASIEKIYGDVESQGKRFFPGWSVGAEVAGPNGVSGWIGQEIEGANGPGVWATYGSGFLRFVVPWARTQSAGIDNAQLFRQFDIDRDAPKLEELQQIIDANDPDLSAFRKHGGKLLMYFGWADPQLNARMGVEYYEKVLDVMGPSTKEFARLFMVPGMFHCGGGVGTSQFDVATPAVQWVESSQAPVRIEAARVVAGKVVRTRPLCPYPQVAKYKGSGSIDQTANFACANP